MSTSGSTDFTETARGVVKDALVLVGVCQKDEDPDADDAALGLKHLNLMLKTWGADPEPKLWLVTEGTQALSDATASYTLTSARKVLSVRRRVSGIDLPMHRWSRQEYFDQPNKSATGYPVNYYFDPQRASRSLYVWPVPDATIAAAATLYYTYLRVIEDADDLSNDLDVPQEWLEVIVYGLAARLSMPYKMHIADLNGAKRLEERAASLYAQLSAYDDEDSSVYLQPNFRY